MKGLESHHAFVLTYSNIGGGGGEKEHGSAETFHCSLIDQELSLEGITS